MVVHTSYSRCLLVVSAVAGSLFLGLPGAGGDGQGKAAPAAAPKREFAHIKPLLAKYCLTCHSTKAKKGSLDLERFATLDDIRKEVKPWQGLIEQVEAGEMPPKGKPQPSDAEKKELVGWVREFLDAEARARSGDPGHVPLRRLSNAEYDATIRDLTGVDLRPSQQFPADGAAGEGFTNAAESLSDISPTLLGKYLNAAKDIADHAVPLPEGFRFSLAKTRRDWTDEGKVALRKFYAEHFGAGDGKLPLQPYLLATVRHRDSLTQGKLADVAVKERLNAKYLGVLWETLNDKTPSQPLDAIRARWRTATEKDVAGLTADVAAWQSAVWKTVRIGSYVRESWGSTAGKPTESLTRQVALDPAAVETLAIKLPVKPAPGQSEVVLYLAANEVAGTGPIRWQRPRFEGPGRPTLLLRDYADFGPTFEVDYPSAFANAQKYLAAAVELAQDPKVTAEDVAKRHDLEPAFLKQWVKVVALPSRHPESGRPVVALTPLDERTKDNKYAGVSGWRKKGADLPIVVANASDKTMEIPGRLAPHSVAVHPTPQENVAVTWKSPITGTVNLKLRVVHAHGACGNGINWWCEQRHGDRATLLGEGHHVPPGKEAKPLSLSLKVEKGDLLVFAVDANGDHSCDLTALFLTIAEEAKPNRTWDLGADVSADVQAGNPHADKHGNADVWGFVSAPAKRGQPPSAAIPPNSILGRWREAAGNPERKAEADKLAADVQTLLSGVRPAKDKGTDHDLYDRLVASSSPLFASVDVTRVAKRHTAATAFGLPRERFGKGDGDSLIVPSNELVEIRLPAALFAGREFVVEARLEGPAGERMVRTRAAVTRPDAQTRWDGPILTAADGAAYKQLLAGFAQFRKTFPLYVCFPQVVPTDEVVSLKMFHREDEPLIRLFLTEEQTRKLDRLWAEHRFVSRQPVAEYAYLPQFMAYTTQDTPKEFQQFFIDRKPLFQKQAEAFEAEELAAIPKQVDALVAFAEKAYRRPMRDQEKTELRTLYEAIRKKGANHDEAFRGVLTRALVAPAFLFRVEQATPGERPGAVNDWELACRLSYFLWSSMPDEELRRLAAEGKLHEPKVLEAQVRRMLLDPRLRALAIEFGTQSIHVRGFDELKEKNEKLFPEFDAKLRQTIYEESILFFQDLFQADRPVLNLLDADYTFLNESLAKHYGIPGVKGGEWRRVESVRKFGRGGILGLASVQTKQAGASRTSPVLRGNWVVETLLGEKLPKPPPNVPQLPEEEGADKLTMRQLVERHAKDPACAVCHVRIDPFGFALEKYDPIGRRRDKDRGGPIDARAKLRDGTEFDDIDGLRTYLLTKKKDVIVRLFCRRLLGYALGRGVTLSDTALIDEMVAELDRSNGKISAAVLTIVRSPQFRMIRGADFPTDH